MALRKYLKQVQSVAQLHDLKIMLKALLITQSLKNEIRRYC